MLQESDDIVFRFRYLPDLIEKSNASTLRLESISFIKKS